MQNDLAEMAASVPFWWHSIDLGDGIVTPGHKSAELLKIEWDQLQLGDLRGKTVLDIGSWDGYFAFTAERLGAARVVALDWYVWSMDLGRQQAYYRECLERGEKTQPFEEMPELWRPAELPGKKGFDTAKVALESRVEDVVGDFMSIDLAELGTFDVTFFLGLLYHLRHPLLALERLAQVTAGSAYLETAAIAVPGFAEASLCAFYETDELAGDPSNWWGPTAPAVLGLCRAAGFRQATLLTQPPVPQTGSIIEYRTAIRADK
jgi:tRNA (mo5U34)-methyltransferase